MMFGRRLVASLCLVAGLVTLTTAQGMAKAPAGLIPASHGRFLLEGRFDRADPAHPVIIWSGSRVSIDFSGPTLAVLFSRAKDQSVFNITVDGKTEIVDVRAGQEQPFVWPYPLDRSRHHLEIFKRSEAGKGHVALDGIQLAKGAKTWAPRKPAPRLKFEFFGDSITAGACNEDGAVDQWDDFRTHNHALSYGYLTSQAFGADHRAMAVSGMGIITGWVDVKTREVWDKLYPEANSPRADLTAWQPDVLFINYGENDASYTGAHQQPFPPDFTAGYVSLVRTVRVAYPHAQIVLLRGGMTGGAKNPMLREAWTEAVRQLEQSDPKVAHFVFQHFSELHPRVADDRAMAEELVAWLKTQPFVTNATARRARK